ncbi:MAG: FAD-binding domain-containing protein [Pseudomonadota bacterium]
MGQKPQLVWLKRDLRAHDHAALARAAAAGPVLPLYIAEPGLWTQADASARQWAFIAESLHELNADLTRLGAPLILRIGDAVDIFKALRKKHGVSAIWAHEETGNAWTFARDKRVAAWARANGVAFHELPQGGVVRRLKTRNGWARQWDSFMAEAQINAPALTPVTGLSSVGVPNFKELGLPADPCPERQPGGRSQGRACLESFLTERGAPYRAAMAAPDAGAQHCSRLSPHLAFGTLSMREVAQAAAARHAVLKANAAPKDATNKRWRGAMVSFTGRLHWRHHFMQKLEDEPRLEFENLHRGFDGMRPTEPDAARLAAFAAGETGLPFVDACLRSLRATGWLNFRMRAMLTAFASYHLWLPWRASGEQLARWFTDYEPGIHWPQIQMQSGTTGINTVRVYNPVKQGLDHDPSGAFTRRWIPELAGIPDAFLQTPWKWPNADAVLGRRYPHPIVDPLTAAREAKDRIFAVRKGARFACAANAIQQKHGSRKSGIPMTGRAASRRSNDLSRNRRTRAGKNARVDARQLTLDL